MTVSTDNGEKEGKTVDDDDDKTTMMLGRGSSNRIT